MKDFLIGIGVIVGISSAIGGLGYVLVDKQIKLPSLPEFAAGIAVGAGVILMVIVELVERLK